MSYIFKLLSFKWKIFPGNQKSLCPSVSLMIIDFSESAIGDVTSDADSRLLLDSALAPVVF